MIVVDGVTKRFGRVEALRDVSFSIARGEVVGFVGPNGAGKTTTLRVITGYLDPDQGRVEVSGHDVARAPEQARRAIGYMPEAVPLYPEMRVEEYLRFRARIKGVPRAEIAARVGAALERAGVDDHRRRLVGHLSRGYRQRVGVADALVADPPILILDEPTAGLDPVQVRQFRGLLAELASERTVLLSSHVLAEIERVASRVLVIARGRIVGDDRPAALRAALGLDPDCAFEEVFVALAGGDAEEAR